MADGNGGRILRDSQENPNPEVQLRRRKATVAAEYARFERIGAVNARVVTDYFPREPMMAGDPASPGGTKVTLEELADDVLAALGGGSAGVRVREADGSPDINPTTVITVPNDTLTPGGPGEAVLDFNAFTLREVVLGPFVETVAPGTAINIQTGVYAGAFSPVPRTGDLDVTFPAAGVTFKDDGRIEVHLNGQELPKGDGTGNGVAEWVSATQVKLGIKVKNKDTLLVRAPFPTA